MPNSFLPPNGLLAANVYPDFAGIGGAGQLAAIVGALLTVVLIVAVLMLVVCAVAWAIASSHGDYRTASRARTGLWIAVGSAVLAGGAVTWANFLIHLGATL